MMLFERKLDIEKIIRLRLSQYVQALPIEGIVTAGGTLPVALPLSKIGSFLVLSFTGFYTSLRIKVAGVSYEDLGICPLRMKISAGASGLEMFGDYVPMNLLLTPGRVRVDPADPGLILGGLTLAAADIGPAPNQLFYPYQYQFPFISGDTITVTVKNDFDAAASGTSNRFGINFLGVRVADIGKALRETKNIPLPKK